MAPSDRRQTARLARAARPLDAETGTARDAACAIGFESVAHVSNAFLTYAGTRPPVHSNVERWGPRR